VVARLARDEGVQPPALQLPIYPATDYVSTTRSRTPFADGFSLTKREIGWFRHDYLDGADVDLCDPRVSPLLADDLSGRPPLILTGGFDPLRDEGEHFRKPRGLRVMVDHREFGSPVHGFATSCSLGGHSATATTAMISALPAHPCALPRP
jgi:acetyl esterase